MQLTLLHLARMSLSDVIRKAEAQQPGTVYFAIPVVQDGRPVVDVLAATKDGLRPAVEPVSHCLAEAVCRRRLPAIREGVVSCEERLVSWRVLHSGVRS